MGDMQDLFNEDGQSNEVPQITSGGSGQPMSIVNVHHDSSAAPTIVKLNGTNYSVWSQLLELHVAGKGKYGYLTGASAAPALANSNYNKWYAENAIVKGWLIQSMEPDIMQIFLPYKTAKDVWENVKKTYYDGQDQSQIYELTCRAFKAKQSGRQLVTYYAELQSIWHEIDYRRPNKFTNSSDILLRQQEIEIERVYVFLAGLDDVFDRVRSDILRMDPFPNLEKAFSCVRREDQRRSTMMVPLTPVNTGVAMVARNSRPTSSYKPADSTINGPTRHSMHASSYKPAGSTANGPTGSTRPNGPQRVKPQNGERCTHCNSTNHFVTDCFKLHGYPEWWDEVKERNKAKVAAERYAQGKVALCIGSPDPSVPQASPMPSVSSSIVPPGFAALPTEREEVICNEKENAVTSVEDLASHVGNPTLFPATPHIPHNCSPSSTPTVPVQIPEASDNPEEEARHYPHALITCTFLDFRVSNMVLMEWPRKNTVLTEM
ncbi:hypothetical protein L3X38_036415 [Prunus dulcis]|uniref:Retrotransposon Copia-like N-terminal domain-containing protein n=1 Tax=Prunus dulcis TaxID=3755 RepID=A0AAD4V2H9_PRUDU|nr:hypothetical protein L3X38_036415 [Prunus dulcis]